MNKKILKNLKLAKKQLAKEFKAKPSPKTRPNVRNIAKLLGIGKTTLYTEYRNELKKVMSIRYYFN